MGSKQEIEKECKFCGKMFVTIHSAKKYCSDECRKANYGKGDTALSCSFCGLTFSPSGRKVKYCSPECRYQAKLASTCRGKRLKRLGTKHSDEKTVCKRRKTNQTEISKIAKAAETANMSYGQYVAKYGV